MNYANIKWNDIANGLGVRVSLFVSGCTHHCKNCFNEIAWEFDYGDPLDEKVKDEIIEHISRDEISGLTILGGEPMEPENQKGVLEIVKMVREECPTKNIWIYTGDVFEKLMNSNSNRHTEYTQEIMENIDVLVDGPFVQDLYDIMLRFRGSSNQRIIDMKKTIETGKVVLLME